MDEEHPDADELVRRLILRRFRHDHEGSHLANCPGAEAVDTDASNGEYGCDTGCEFARFEATIRCSHGESQDYEWGNFGDIDSCIEEMLAEDRPMPAHPTGVIAWPTSPEFTLGPGDSATWTTTVRLTP